METMIYLILYPDQANLQSPNVYIPPVKLTNFPEMCETNAIAFQTTFAPINPSVIFETSKQQN